MEEDREDFLWGRSHSDGSGGTDNGHGRGRGRGHMRGGGFAGSTHWNNEYINPGFDSNPGMDHDGNTKSLTEPMESEQLAIQESLVDKDSGTRKRPNFDNERNKGGEVDLPLALVQPPMEALARGENDLNLSDELPKEDRWGKDTGSELGSKILSTPEKVQIQKKAKKSDDVTQTLISATPGTGVDWTQ